MINGRYFNKEIRRLAMTVSNTSYNLAKQLTKTLQLLWNIDKYIEDAQREGDSQTAGIWRQMKADTERHATLIRERINELVGTGAF